MTDKFWEQKNLEQMTNKEWEALCDGCARCCLIKLEDEDTGKLHYTSVACSLLDLETCSCKDYPNRSIKQPGCVKLTQNNADKLYWMPKSCAYKRLAQGKKLNSWHPLVSNNKDSVHDAGVSIRSFAVLETGDEDLEDYIIDI